MKNLLQLLVILCIVGCSQQKPTTLQGEVIKIDINNDLISKDDLLALRDDVKILPLKCSEIGSVDDVVCKNGNYYILSHIQKRIYAFDSLGNLLFKIDKSGRAKGEYNFIKSMHSFGSVLRIWDGGASKMIDYSNVDGQFIAEYLFDERVNGVISNGDIIVIYNDENVDNKMLNVHDMSMNKLYESVDVLPVLGNQTTYIQQETPFFSHGDKIYCNPKFTNDIYLIQRDSAVMQYRLDFGKKNITDTALNQFLKDGCTTVNTFEYAVFIDIFNISDHYLSFMFVCDGERYIVYYNRITKKTNLMNMTEEDKAYLFSSLLSDLTTEDGYLVSSINRLTFMDSDIFFRYDPLMAEKINKAIKENSEEHEYYLILQRYK